MSDRLPLDGRAVLWMLLLCGLWGLQQVLLKATADLMAPMLQIGLRSGIAALLVAALMAWRRERMTLRSGVWQPGLVVGLLFGLEYWAVGEGLRHTSAGHMVVFLYTAPIFAALGLHLLLPAERLNRLQWAGVLLAFAGLALAFLARSAPSPQSGPPAQMLLGDALGLFAGLAWGATTVVVRSTQLAPLPATQTLLYQLVGAFVLLVPAALWLGHGQTVQPTAALGWALAFQAVVISFASFLVWFWLLRVYLASRLGVFSFLTPLFGVLLGAWWLGEPLEPAFLGGALLVMAGIVLVSGHAVVARGLGRLKAPAGGPRR